MHPIIEEQQERSKAIKLLIDRWVKSHKTKPKTRYKTGKYLIPAKKIINPPVS